MNDGAATSREGPARTARSVPEGSSETAKPSAWDDHTVVACRDLRKTYRNGPLDVPVLLGDHGRLTAATGWIPEIPMAQTLHDILVEQRAAVRT